MGRTCGRYGQENSTSNRVLVEKPKGKRHGRKNLNNFKMYIREIR
jgi:hypothetical protein